MNDFFSLDNKYLLSLKMLFLHPKQILTEYLEGTRKKYVSPFAFLAIGTALAMLVFNEFSDNFLEISNVINETQFDLVEGQVESTEIMVELEKERIESKEMAIQIQKHILKYFNIITFLLIPFYALTAFVVYRKPYNYGEHLIITCYVQGLLFLSTILFFIMGLVIHPSIYYLSIPVGIIYYLYAYGKLYGLTFGQNLIKLLRFLGISLILIIVLGVFAFLVGLMFAFLFK